jgi:stage II sporulation protein D
MLQKLLLSCLLAINLPLFADITPEGEQQLREIRERFDGPSLRVQLMHDVDGAQVEVKGPYNVFDPRTGRKLDSAYLSSSYYMYPTRDGVRWGQEFPSIYQLLLVPDRADTTVMVAGTEYRGMAYLYQIKGTLGGVNELSLEDFVRSLLSSHIPVEVTEKEALAALAIALRTETLSWLANAQNPYWDIRANTVGYKGSAVERKDRPFIDAISHTKDLIIKKGGTSDLVSIRWFSIGEPMAPIQDMQQLAKEGKDARAILEKLLGNVQIVKLQNIKGDKG